MAKENGGVIGVLNTPTATTASGVWALQDQYEAKRNGNWPRPPFVSSNSLRFNPGSSDYLNRTSSSSPTNNKIATFSGWVKRSSLGSALNVDIFDQYTDGQNYAQIMFYQDNILIFQRDSTSNNIQLVTTQVFRDVSAWYHIVVAYDTTQATASNRVKLYVNGSQVTSFSTETYPSQNLALRLNSSSLPLYIGTYSAGNYYDGYMSEFNFIDGQALTPSSFGASNASGVWYPIPYAGSYGTNGFNLKFTNASSLGTDSSPNGNNFTVNNLTSVDQSTDSTLNNFCTINPLDVAPSQTFTDGNLTCSYGATNVSNRSSFALDTGKWYWEMKVTSISGGGLLTGVTDSTQSLSTWVGATTYSYGYYSTNGQKYNNNSGSAYGNSYTNNDIIGIAFDATNGKIYFSKNGTFQNSGNPATDTNPAFTGLTGRLFFPATSGYSGDAISYNFGSPAYSANSYADGAGYGNFSYAVPSGYYALCTANLNTYG